MSKMIKAERALLARFRGEARRNLGPTATEAEVEAEASAAYEGEPAIGPVVETDEQRQRREHNTAMARRNYLRWKV